MDRIAPEHIRRVEPPVEFGGLKGFIATVEKPSDLNIFGMDARIGVDLFVNGRLRERNIMSHRPSSRYIEQYAYGQVHFDELDPGCEKEPFTSSRESVVEGNDLFESLLNYLLDIFRNPIVPDWDEGRDLLKKNRLQKKDQGVNSPDAESASEETEKFVRARTKKLCPNADVLKRQSTFDNLLAKAEVGIADSVVDYHMIYILENLMREFISEYDMPLTSSARNRVKQFVKQACNDFEKSDLETECRRRTSETAYLGLSDLVNIIEDKKDRKIRSEELQAQKDAIVYLRNIVMHTSQLNDYGRQKLEAYVDILKSMLQAIAVSQDQISGLD